MYKCDQCGKSSQPGERLILAYEYRTVKDADSKCKKYRGTGRNRQEIASQVALCTDCNDNNASHQCRA